MSTEPRAQWRMPRLASSFVAVVIIWLPCRSFAAGDDLKAAECTLDELGFAQRLVVHAPAVLWFDVAGENLRLNLGQSLPR